MKYLIIISAYFGIYQLGYCQCGGTIVLSSRADVDNFSVNYPNCTNLTGGLHISGPDITNLNGLNVLTAVSGNQLLIQENQKLIFENSYLSPAAGGSKNVVALYFVFS